MNNKIERMKELIETLNHASKLYYQFNASAMTDFEYDRLYDELVELEKETNTTLSNSPTINVETEIASSLEQYPHPKRMLSLAKTKDLTQLADFLGEEVGVLSWKLDGLTVVLTYENGNLVRGVTRGNGTVGEIVTDNVKRFKNVPLTIPYSGSLVIRGEAIIKYTDFKKLNEELKDSEEQFKNPRNLCSGSVRQLNSNITAERNVNFVLFTLISSDKEFTSKLEQYDWLESLGFETVENIAVDKTNLAEKVQEFESRVKKYDVPSDGLVLTFDNISYSTSLGSTEKHPKDSLAFKWKDETRETNLISVDWSVSRTGLINPIAIFSPVDLEGTTVSRASLHNLSIIEGLQLGIRDMILVYKANMIIPQVAANLTKSNSLAIPTCCPACNHEAVIKQINDIKYLYCTNDACVAKLLKRLSLFISKNAMNIEGLSDATVSQLIAEGLITTYTDIYHLSQHRDAILGFEGFGKKSYENLIASIDKSKEVKLANFIYALGIPEVGLSRAKLICNKSKNDYETAKGFSLEDLSEIAGIGDIVAKEWVTAFQDVSFVTEADRVVQEIRFIDANNLIEATLVDQTLVITGNVYHFENRNDLVAFIEKHGGKVVSSISSKVDYLINNDINSNSTKNRQAKELGIGIISEEKLLKLTKSKSMRLEDLARSPKCHCSVGKPRLLQVKIINRCTGNCSFCIDKGNFAPQEVDADKMIEAILSELDYLTVDITGGEPFLDFDVLIKVLKAIRPHKEYIVVNTNGSLLTPEKVEQLNGLIDFLKIGVQHYDETKNAEIIKTKISFENIKKSLENKQFKVWFNMVVNKSWQNDEEVFVEKMVELCRELNVDGVSMNEIRYTGTNKGYEEYAEDHIKGYEFFKHLDIIKPKKSNQLITEGCVDDFEYKGIEFRLKRLCGYKFKSKEQTFKVIYSNGLKVDDWILDI